jgi:hypothetical protein
LERSEPKSSDPKTKAENVVWFAMWSRTVHHGVVLRSVNRNEGVAHQVVPPKGRVPVELILQQVMPDGIIRQTKVGCN